MDVRAQVQHTTLEVEPSDVVHNEQEKPVMRKLLDEEHDNLSRVDQDIYHPDSGAAGHYEGGKLYIGPLDGSSFSLAPRKRLPPELLTMIFLQLQEGQPVVLPPSPSKPPWVLQRVCSQWREVAWEEGRLWSELDVRDPPSGRAEDMVVTWIPRLWSIPQSFPLSLSFPESSAENGVAIGDVLAPYYHRLKNLSLHTRPLSLPSIFFNHSYSFDALESLVLNIGGQWREAQFFPQKGQIFTIFTASPKLRKATFTASASHSLPKFYKLPWIQLTHLAFRVVQLHPQHLQAILRQCKNLICLTFTSTPMYNDPDYSRIDAAEINLPHLKSLTVFLEGGYSCGLTFPLLRVPLLKEVTFDTTMDESYGFHHAELIDMIRLSGSSIESLSLLLSISRWSPGPFLEELPGLVRLVVSPKSRVPGVIFDMMAQGEILHNLEYLECYTHSPVAFMKLVERQRKLSAASEWRGLSTANVMYDEVTADCGPREIQKLYKRLKPKWERCGMDVVVRKIDYMSLFT